jgi:hypothetical protein
MANENLQGNEKKSLKKLYENTCPIDLTLKSSQVSVVGISNSAQIMSVK